jgi:hypothetical protein
MLFNNIFLLFLIKIKIEKISSKNNVKIYYLKYQILINTRIKYKDKIQ